MKWMERSRRRSLNVRMRHGDDDGTNKAQTWATVCAQLSRKTVKGQRTLTDNNKRDNENEGSTMHDDSCIGINCAHAPMFPTCFKSLHPLLGFVLCFVSSIEFLSPYPFTQFWPVREFLLEFTLRKRVFWGGVFTVEECLVFRFTTWNSGAQTEEHRTQLGQRSKRQERHSCQQQGRASTQCQQ